MARFDVFRNSGERASSTPYLLDVQSDLLGQLDTRVVIPLRRQPALQEFAFPDDLAPIIQIDGIPCLLETPKMAAVPTGLLRSRVGSLADRHDLIMGAIDRLFHGF